MNTVDRTDPYPWPYDGRLDPRRTALVVAGAQPAWRGRSLHVDAVAAVIDRVAAAVRATGGQIVVVTHLAPTVVLDRGPRPALPPLPGTPEADPLDIAGVADVVVAAVGMDGFFGSTLDHELRRRGLDRLVLVGYGYEATVECTLRGANDRGYECLTLVDAVAPFGDDTAAGALSSITMSGGIFGAIGTSTELLAALALLQPHADLPNALQTREQP